MSSEKPRKKIIALVLWSVIMTMFAGIFAATLQKRYFDHHPYFFDAVSYSFYNVKLYHHLQEAGRGAVAIEELANNTRNPLRTVPLILLAPKLLIHPFGHMATSLPALFAFVFLLGLTLYRALGRLAPAFAGSAIVVLLPGLYSPISGVAAYWLDLTAAMLIGAAVLALMLSSRGQNLRWVIVFVVLGSCAAFTRYVSIAYLVFASAPVFAWDLVARAREDGSWLRSALVPVLVVTGAGLLLAGPYLFAHVRFVSEFYRVYGYAWGVPIGTAMHMTLASLKEFIAPSGIMASSILAGAWLLQIVKTRRFDTEGLFALAWLSLAIPIFLIFFLKTSAIHTIPYAVVLLLVAFTFLWVRLAREKTAVLKRAGLIILLIIVSGWGGYFTAQWKLAVKPSPELAEGKELQTRLANILAQYGNKHLVWNAYFDEISWIPTLDAFYRHGVLALPLGQDYVFSIHETVYRGNFPGWDKARIGEALFNNAKTWLNIAVVFDEPSDAEKFLPNESSRYAARYLADAIKNSPSWRKDNVIDTRQYGRLAVYWNLHPKAGNFERVLKGQANLKPMEIAQ